MSGVVKIFARPGGRGPVLLRSATRLIKRKRSCPYCGAVLSVHNPGDACRLCQTKLHKGVVLQKRRRK